jgi:hypothetical protein
VTSPLVVVGEAEEAEEEEEAEAKRQSKPFAVVANEKVQRLWMAE